MAFTTFSGPIRVGKDDGSANPPRGTVCVVQKATAVTTAQIAQLPEGGADILDIFAHVLIGSSAAAGGTAINVGVAGDATKYGTITVSSVGLFHLTAVSATNLANQTGAIVAACPTATAASNVVVGLIYQPRG